MIINLSKNASLGGVLEIFVEESPFGDRWNHFYHAQLNLSRQDALFKYPYDNVLDHNFLDKKSGKIGRNSKNLSPSSLSLINAQGFIF